MKNLFVRLMAILAMSLSFVACGNDDDSETTDAAESGKTLYENYTAYKTADASTAEGLAAKTSAALNMYNSYKEFTENKDDSSWVQEFAEGACENVVEDKKETAKTTLISKLTEGNIVNDSASDKITAVANLVTELSNIF